MKMSLISWVRVLFESQTKQLFLTNLAINGGNLGKTVGAFRKNGSNFDSDSTKMPLNK